jgi:hypothetical protein
MITMRQAKKYLRPGDEVYIYDEGRVVSHRIKKILSDSLVVEDGFLVFDEHGFTWWLTEKVAKEQLG